MPESMSPLIGFRHFFFIALLVAFSFFSRPCCADMPLLGYAGLMFSNAFSDGSPLEHYSPGFSLDGGLRLSDHFSAGIRLSYHKITLTHQNWYEFNAFADWTIRKDENPFEFYAGAGLGDSILAGQHGLAVVGHAGVNWWFSERLALNGEGLFEYVFGISQLQDPSFALGKFLIGVKWQF